MLWTKQPRDKQQSPSHIGFQLSKTLTKCEAHTNKIDIHANLISSFFIKGGKVSEFGTHDQLISRRGDYHDYVHLQGLSKG